MVLRWLSWEQQAASDNLCKYNISSQTPSLQCLLQRSQRIQLRRLEAHDSSASLIYMVQLHHSFEICFSSDESHF